MNGDALRVLQAAIDRALDPVTDAYIDARGLDRAAMLAVLVPKAAYEPLRKELAKTSDGTVTREDAVKYALDQRSR